MEQARSANGRPRVAVVGGGVAGLEAMLALRDMVGDRVEIALHSPSRSFSYRPPAVGAPFGAGGVVKYDLEDLTTRAGATFSSDSIAAVEGRRRRIVTRDGERHSYDYLLLASGTRMLWAVPGAVTFWGVAGEGGVPDLMRRLHEGELRHLVFTMPGSGWPLPIYELALLTEADLARSGIEGVKLTVVTPEDLPLGIFGLRAGEQVRDLLERRGIELVAGTHPVMYDGTHLRVAPEGRIEADAVISTPRIEGRLIPGVPHTPAGFIPVDDHGRVLGLERAFAAGDVTSFPVKHGGIATQQADVAAEALVADLGLGIEPAPFDPVLRATLWTGEKPQYLYGMLAGGHGETSRFSDEAPWEDEGKIVGRYLGPFLSSLPGEGVASQTGGRVELRA
jgi:sulfide:quinone oxidoreductase